MLEHRFPKMDVIDRQVLLNGQFLLTKHQENPLNQSYRSAQSLTVQYLNLLKKLEGSTDYYAWRYFSLIYLIGGEFNH